MIEKIIILNLKVYLIEYIISVNNTFINTPFYAICKLSF